MGSGKSGLYSGATPREIQACSEPKSGFNVSDVTNKENTGNSFSNYIKTIDSIKQGKHIPGSDNYIPGKSMLTISLEHAQELVDKYTGNGDKVNDNKERVDFGETIGKYVDPSTGAESDTTIGIIHYSKTGTHIVPAKPKGGR